MRIMKLAAAVAIAWALLAGCGETFSDARDDTRGGDAAADVAGAR